MLHIGDHILTGSDLWRTISMVVVRKLHDDDKKIKIHRSIATLINGVLFLGTGKEDSYGNESIIMLDALRRADAKRSTEMNINGILITMFFHDDMGRCASFLYHLYQCIKDIVDMNIYIMDEKESIQEFERIFARRKEFADKKEGMITKQSAPPIEERMPPPYENVVRKIT